MSSGRVLFSFLLLSQVIFVNAQDLDFKPCETFSEKSKDKIQRIRERTRLEVAKINSPKKNQIERMLNERLDFLTGEFANKKFIDNAVLQNAINKVWATLLEKNSLKNIPGEILISTSSDVNAFSWGEGTMIVNAGLLSRMKNESQLAFTLAHELAHYELNHLLLTITKQVESAEWKKVMSALNRIRAGRTNEYDYVRIISWIYSTSSFHRKDEVAADSLGFIIFKNAGYRQTEAVGLLHVLDSAHKAKYISGEKLFEPLSFADIPFKTSWVKDQSRHYVKDTLQDYFLDSIRSHPHSEERIRRLSKVTKDEGEFYRMDAKEFQAAVRLADFESVQGALNNRRIDKCLFQALQLRSQFPKSDYLATMIGRVLLSVNMQRINPKTRQFYASSPEYYSYDLRAVINFLNNISLSDLGEITYRFINSKKNFNPENEEHYFILWKIADITNRAKTMEKVHAAYEAKFPDGEYIKDMKFPEITRIPRK